MRTPVCPECWRSSNASKPFAFPIIERILRSFFYSLVRNFVLFVYPWSSSASYDAYSSFVGHLCKVVTNPSMR